ncbi:hypothetical protein [Cohnella sp. 56]|uniref:hypothetical protein n=1 Tax=Cohnella sp. 56 TaxID=3113722 RepID=UPI0030E84132
MSAFEAKSRTSPAAAASRPARATAAPATATLQRMQSPAAILQMQRALGNASVLQLLTDPSKLPASMPSPKSATQTSLAGAHLRSFKKENDATGNETFEVDANTMVGGKIKYRGELDMYEIYDKTGNWKLAKFGSDYGFIRKEKLKPMGGLSGARDKLAEIKAQQSGGALSSVGNAPEDDKDALEDNAELADTVKELGTLVPGAKSEQLEMAIDDLKGVAGKEDDKDALENAKSHLDVGTGPLDFVMSGVGGLVAMKKTLSAARDTEKSGHEKRMDVAEGVIDTAKAGQELVESGASVVNDAGVVHTGEGIGHAEAVSDWSGSVGEAISAIKSAFSVVKGIYDMFKKGMSDEGLSKDEAITGTLDLLENSLQAAQGVVKTVKSIKDILDVGTAGLATAIPGIGIAISGISITIKTYNSIKATVSVMKMTAAKREFKGAYGAGGKNKDYIVASKKRTLGGVHLWSTNAGTDPVKLKARKDQLIALGANADAEEAQELKDIQDYELAKEMKYINRKRQIRGTMEIGLEMTNIAGDIATLTGVGAQVGVPLKAAAAGAGATMSVARTVKQMGRDRAAQPGAWGVTKAVFNADKSSAVKLAKRIEHSNLILEMVAALPEYRPGDESTLKQYKRVENFIAASGISPSELYRLNGNVEKQRELLVKGMKER